MLERCFRIEKINKFFRLFGCVYLLFLVNFRRKLYSGSFTFVQGFFVNISILMA